MTTSNPQKQNVARQPILFTASAIAGWLLLALGMVCWSKLGTPIGLAVLILATITLGVIEIMVLIGVCLNTHERHMGFNLLSIVTILASAACVVVATYLVVDAIKVAGAGPA